MRRVLACLLALPLAGCVTTEPAVTPPPATLAPVVAPAGTSVLADLSGDGLGQLDVAYPSFHAGPEWMYLWANHCDGDPGKTHDPLSFNFQGTPEGSLGLTPGGVATTHADDSGREYLHNSPGTFNVHLEGSDCRWHIVVADCPKGCGTEPSQNGVFQFSGHRSYDSALINVTDNAEFAYTYDCTARASEYAGPALRFQLTPEPDPSQASLGSATDDRLAGAGVGHFYLDHPGPVSISIEVEDCEWTVRVGALDKTTVPPFQDTSPLPRLPLKAGTHSHVVLDAVGTGSITSRPEKMPASWELAFAQECNTDAAPDEMQPSGPLSPAIQLIPGADSQDLGILPIPTTLDVSTVLPVSQAGTYGVETLPPMSVGCLWHYQLRD